MNHSQFSPSEIITKAEQIVIMLKSKSQQTRVRRILHQLLSIEIDIKELRGLVSKGLPHELNKLRVLCWLVCLGVLTNRPAAWSAILRQRKLQYQQYEKTLIGNIQSLEQLSQKQRSLLLTIQKDTLRTLTNCSFFHLTTSATLPHSRSADRLNHINSVLRLFNIKHSLDINTFVFDHLSYLLLIYSNVYCSSRYVQSMSGLLAPIFFAVNVSSQDINHFIPFALFRQIHKPLQNFTIKELDSTQVGIFRFLQKFESTLCQMSPKIADKLKQLELRSHFYVLGWVLTIFSQNFQLHKLLLLWDFLLSSNDLVSEIQQTCMAVLEMRKDTIKRGNVGQIMESFKNLNDLEIEELIEAKVDFGKRLYKSKKQSPIKTLVNLFSEIKFF